MRFRWQRRNSVKAMSAVLASAIAIFALVAVWQPGSTRVAEAAATVTTLGNRTASADTAQNAVTPSFTAGADIAFTEASGSAPEAAGTIIIAAAPGWRFDPANPPEFGVADLAGGEGCNAVIDLNTNVAADGSTISVAINTPAAAASNDCKYSIYGYGVQPVTGAGVGNSNMTRTAGAGLPGIANGTNVGTLTKTVGALNDFFIEAAAGGPIQPVTTGTPFNVKVTARDFFGNTQTAFTDSVTIGLIACGTASLTAGAGPTALFSGGVLTSHSVTITTTAVQSGCLLTAINLATTGKSASFTVNPTPTPPAPTPTPPAPTPTPPAPTPTPPPGGQKVTVNGGTWTSGQNGVVLEGGGQASGMALIIQQASGRGVLAIWVLSGGLYQFFLPATPGVSSLMTMPGLLIAGVAVLA